MNHIDHAIATGLAVTSSLLILSQLCSLTLIAGLDRRVSKLEEDEGQS